MRGGQHVVTLPRGSISIPLDFETFMAIAQVREDPAKPDAGGVDPGKVLRGEQDLPLVTRWAVLHAAAGTRSPGVKAIAAMGNDLEMTKAVWMVCVELIKTLTPPEEVAAEAPKVPGA